MQHELPGDPGLRARFRGCLLGLAVGDAVGTSVEFRPRGSFTPITDMIGGGPFGLEPGQWTDDTSMALCLATSLTRCGGFDAADQMDRYLRWWDTGYLSSTGECFDIGSTTAAALARYRESGDPFAGTTHARAAGNGSLMRLAPVPMFFYPDRRAAERYARESSRTTHASPACIDACRLFAGMLCRALGGQERAAVLLDGGDDFEGVAEIQALARGTYLDEQIEQIQGTGYVVDSLEAALWCFERSSTFEETILAAANLGDDADTTAAIAGQIAGAFYGELAIPPRWRAQLALADVIGDLADALFEGSGAHTGATG